MLVQHRDGECWLIKQHDHGVMSGELAAMWRGLEPEAAGVGAGLLLATTLHDLPWLEEDRAPVWDPDSREARDFLHVPLAYRLPLYSRGLDQMEEIHPYSALLVSMHYAAFAGLRQVEAFQQAEGQRQQRLRQRLDIQGSLEWELRALQLFDLLSLYICLTAPGALARSCPPWMMPQGQAETPEGSTFTAHWESPQRLRFSPMPFARDFAVQVPLRALPGASFATDRALAQAWEAAHERLWRIEIAG